MQTWRRRESPTKHLHFLSLEPLGTLKLYNQLAPCHKARMRCTFWISQIWTMTNDPFPWFFICPWSSFPNVIYIRLQTLYAKSKQKTVYQLMKYIIVPAAAPFCPELMFEIFPSSKRLSQILLLMQLTFWPVPYLLAHLEKPDQAKPCGQKNWKNTK